MVTSLVANYRWPPVTPPFLSPPPSPPSIAVHGNMLLCLGLHIVNEALSLREPFATSHFQAPFDLFTSRYDIDVSFAMLLTVL